MVSLALLGHPLLLLLFSDERSNDTNFVLSVLLEFKTVLFGRAELHKVVIEGFFADLDALSSLIE